MSIADDPFALFCIYYLGLTPEGEVRFFNANQVAQRYNWSVDGLLKALSRHDLHPDKVLNTDFPLARFQIDFQLETGSMSLEAKFNRAQLIYERYRANQDKRRDWLQEIAQEKQSGNTTT